MYHFQATLLFIIMAKEKVLVECRHKYVKVFREISLTLVVCITNQEGG